MVYVEEHDLYYPVGNVPKALNYKKLSGTKVRELLKNGEEIPVDHNYNA